MPLTKQTILLLALAAPIIKADVNHDFQARCPGVSNERGGCYSAGFVDKIQSAEDCQAMCQANPDCEFLERRRPAGRGRRVFLRGGGKPRRGGRNLRGALRYLNGHYPHSPLLALEPSLVVTLEPEHI